MGSGVAYLDSSEVLRLIEGSAQLQQAVNNATGDLGVATSLVAVTECMVRPYKLNDAALRRRYVDFFALIDVLDIDYAIADLAAQIRATHRLKTPDALHLAAAAHSGCEIIVTADADFRRLDGAHGVRVVTIPAV